GGTRFPDRARWLRNETHPRAPGVGCGGAEIACRARALDGACAPHVRAAGGATACDLHAGARHTLASYPSPAPTASRSGCPLKSCLLDSISASSHRVSSPPIGTGRRLITAVSSAL